MTEKEKMPQWLKVSFRIMYGVDEWANKYRWLPILCRFSEVAVLMYFQIVKTFIDLIIELLNAPIPNVPTIVASMISPINSSISQEYLSSWVYLSSLTSTSSITIWEQ